MYFKYIETKIVDKKPTNIGPRSGGKLNKFILDTIVSIPKLTEKLKEKYDTIIKKVNNLSNGNNIENWKTLVDEISKNKLKGGVKQLSLIAGIINYSQYSGNKDSKARKFKNNLKIKLGTYDIEGPDDILHILTSATLYNSIGKSFTLKLGQVKELYKDNPSKQEILKKTISKIDIIYTEISKLDNNNLSEKNKLYNKIKLIRKSLPKGSILNIMEDSISDMKSNIIGIMLYEYIEEFPKKTIYNFFVDFKKDNKLQEKFDKLQKEYGLKIEDNKLIKEKKDNKYPLSMMIN